MTIHARDFTIRDAEPRDRGFVTDLLAASGLPLDGIDDVDRLLVAENVGRSVAVAALERHGSGDTTIYLLRSVAVREDVRDTGAGSAVVAAALLIVDEIRAPVALLTETAADYFPRFGFVPVARSQLPRALETSPELRGACPDTARAFIRAAVRSR